MVRKRSKDSLLTFDESSPLFVKKVPSKKKRKPRKSKVVVDTPPDVPDVLEVEEPPEFTKKRKRKRRINKPPVSSNAPKYTIKTPADCKHILPAMKKLLDAKWKLITTGTDREAGDITNWIRGVSTVVRNTRPKEYEELRLLSIEARFLASERSK